MKKIFIWFSLLALIGCAGGQTKSRYLQESADGSIELPTEEVYFEDKLFYVLSSPKLSSMFVTEGIGASAGKGFVFGLSLGILDLSSAPYMYEGAATEMLKKQGRKNCKITRSTKISDYGHQGYEVHFECDQ